MNLSKNLFKSFKFLSVIIIYQTFNFGVKASNEYDYGDYKNLDFFGYLNEIDRRIIEKVDNSQKVLFYPRENTPDCKSENIWGYVNYPTYNEGYFRTDIAICTNRILIQSKNPDNASYNLSETLHHEAFHTAQLCKSPPDFKAFGINNGYFSKSIRDKVYGAEVYADNSPEANLIEMEAFYVEHKPYMVLSYLEEYCL